MSKNKYMRVMDDNLITSGVMREFLYQEKWEAATDCIIAELKLKRMQVKALEKMLGDVKNEKDTRDNSSNDDDGSTSDGGSS